MGQRNLDWKKTADERPEEGVVVNTMDSGGHEQTLRRSGNLWWFPVGSLYVYYTPQMWRYLEI